MATAEFRYVTTSLYQDGVIYNKIIAELPFTGVNFTSQLNSVGTFQGHVLLSGLNSSQLNAYQGTVPGKTILWVLYTDPVTFSSVPVWSGVIWAREYDSASQTLSISAQEMMSLYNRRLISTTKDYSVNPLDSNGYDPAYIAYQLMQYAEALPHGNTGLDYNTLTTSLRTKKIYEGYQLKSVYQAIKDLSANYFDFKIRPVLSSSYLVNVFTLGAPLGTTYSTSSLLAPVLQLPGNIIEYKFPEDASNAANKLYGLGYGNNTTRTGAIATDPSKIADATITNVSGSGSVVTYTVTWNPVNNKFVAGQDVIVSGVSPSQYNGTYTIVSVGTSNFTVASTATGAYSSGGIAKSVWPLLENTTNYTDVGDVNLLKDLTLGQLNATSYPPTTVEVVIAPYVDPYYPTYSVGDQVRLMIQDDYFPSGIDFGVDPKPMRIMAISVNPGENGPSRITLTLTRDLETGIVV